MTRPFSSDRYSVLLLSPEVREEQVTVGILPPVSESIYLPRKTTFDVSSPKLNTKISFSSLSPFLFALTA